MIYLLLFSSEKSLGRLPDNFFPDGSMLPIPTLLMVCCMLKHGLEVYETGLLISSCEFNSSKYQESWLRYNLIIENMTFSERSRLSKHLYKLIRLKRKF